MSPSEAPRKRRVRVLVVDDSLVMRRLLSDLLGNESDIEICGTARNGEEALQKIKELDPDVVTMDIEMPKMDGLVALKQIMETKPIPVIVVSAMDKRQVDITIKALDLGAFDFISKTSGSLSLDIEKTAQLLVAKIRAAGELTPSRMKDLLERKAVANYFRPPERWKRTSGTVIVMGASTGGPKALSEVLAGLPRNLPSGVLVVQHMPEGFTKSFADRLNWVTSLEVREAQEGDIVMPGLVLVAPGNKHMRIKGRKVVLDEGPKVNNVRPSVDPLMISAAEEFGENCIGVVLTGMGSDGSDGMVRIRAGGGRTIAQDQETSIVFGMPRAAIEKGGADDVLPLQDISFRLLKLLEV